MQLHECVNCYSLDFLFLVYFNIPSFQLALTPYTGTSGETVIFPLVLKDQAVCQQLKERQYEVHTKDQTIQSNILTVQAADLVLAGLSLI